MIQLAHQQELTLFGAFTLRDVGGGSDHEDGAAGLSAPFERGHAVNLNPADLATDSLDAIFTNERFRFDRIERRCSSRTDARSVLRRYACHDAGDVGLGGDDIEDRLEALVP